ncbi:glycosyltransferase [Fredinandcohnia quinoae]|uniref:Glycosyltransferase n=1 Tax=Fredinandcohnia quinoae TaxID=2918902 RepID=A0AAW5E7D8_9BACI|nr:glycosyltransferase [Fredinandcohnia sp. SECRCQ15]MCH1627140.1 glycosyltransferase [Fredinandcohnia sp. SECRCQ15]
MYKRFIVFVFIFMLINLNSSFHAHAEKNEEVEVEEMCLNQSVIELKYGMQKLWIEHAWWSRSLIVSTLADLEDREDVLARLLQNQVDIGNIMKPYYGDEFGSKLTDLLQEHILIGGKLIDAVKSNDKALVDKMNKEWYQNADVIVEFLASANPNWLKNELTEMFYAHLQLTINEVEARLQKKWKEDIRTADLNESHLIHMGDFLTDGIVKQFPEKFK